MCVVVAFAGFFRLVCVRVLLLCVLGFDARFGGVQLLLYVFDCCCCVVLCFCCVLPLLLVVFACFWLLFCCVCCCCVCFVVLRF